MKKEPFLTPQSYQAYSIKARSRALIAQEIPIAGIFVVDYIMEDHVQLNK